MDEESEQFMLWPALALIGFLVLTALVIALGTVSTDRYEREQRAGTKSAPPAAESIGVAPTTRSAIGRASRPGHVPWPMFGLRRTHGERDRVPGTDGRPAGERQLLRRTRAWGSGRASCRSDAAGR